jgi:hypothetical protein
MPPIVAYVRLTSQTHPTRLPPVLDLLLFLEHKMVNSVPLIKQVGKVASEAAVKFLYFITPGELADLKDVYDNNSWKSTMQWSFCIAFVHSFIFNAILSWFSGTMGPNVPGYLSFFDDRWNVALYIFVVPLYVAFCVCILREYLLAWTIVHRLKLETAEQETEGASRKQSSSIRTQIMFLVVLAATGIFIVTYFAGVETYHMKQGEGSPARDLYWFVKARTSEGIIYNFVGYYYIVLNAVLLFISLLAATCYVSISIEVMRIGSSIGSGTKLDEPLKNLVKQLLAVFNNTYFFGKMVTFAYVLNTFIFAKSPLGYSHIVNVYASIFIVSMVGLFFVPLPRRSLQNNWNNFLKAIDARRTETEDIDQAMKGIYPAAIKWADLILGLTGLLAFLKIAFEQWGRSGGISGLETYLNFFDPMSALHWFFDSTTS